MKTVSILSTIWNSVKHNCCNVFDPFIELIPLFEKCGGIWDLRLMMDPMTGLNRGYAFVTFMNKDGAQEAVRQVIYRCLWWYLIWLSILLYYYTQFQGTIIIIVMLIIYQFKINPIKVNGTLIREDKIDERTRIYVCWPRRRLFVGNIPKAKSREQLFEEFHRRACNLITFFPVLLYTWLLSSSFYLLFHL